MKRAVIFDLDGTLLNTLDDLGNAMNRVLERRGFPTHPIEAYKIFVGDGIRMLARRCLPIDRRSEARITAVVADMEAEYSDSWNRKTRPYAGVPELLDAIRHRGLATAVLSNKPETFTIRMVHRFFPDYPFVAVRGATDDKPRKPDPTLALEIAGALAAELKDICLLGDTRTDMETALRAGLYPIGALWGFRTLDELEASGAAAVINRPDELLEYLDESS